MTSISTWSTTPILNTAEFPENQAPASLNNGGRDVQAAIREQHEDACWIDLGYTPTGTSTTQFTVSTSSDERSHYTTGRRVRLTDTTTKYGVITSSSYSSPVTTVNVSLDSGDVVAPTAVALGIINENLLLDEDDMASDALAACTQQSIKAYVDAQGDINSGDVMLFYQATVTGWTILAVDLENHTLRVANDGSTGTWVSGTHGTDSIASAYTHTHTMPTHVHKWYDFNAGATDHQTYDSDGTTLHSFAYGTVTTGATAITTNNGAAAGQDEDAYTSAVDPGDTNGISATFAPLYIDMNLFTKD